MENSNKKQKRYLSITWKLIIPLMIVFGVLLLYMYNLIDQFMENTASNIFKSEIRVVRAELDECLDVQAVQDFQSDLVQDEDFDSIYSCMQGVVEEYDRTILATYFEDNDGDLEIGVQYDLIYAEPYEPGTPLDENVISEFLAEDAVDVDLAQEYLLDGFSQVVYQDQYYEYIPDNPDEPIQIFYTGYFPIRETSENDGIIIQVEAGDMVKRINDFQTSIFLGSGLGLVVIAVILYIVASRNTSSIRKLSAAASEVGDGNYEDVDLTGGNWFDDEVSTLEKIFDEMVQKVYEREKALVEKVTELKIFIDEGRKKEDLNQIMSSDMYKDMQSRAKAMRERARGKK